MRARSLFVLCIAAGLQAQPNPADLLRLTQIKISDSLDRTLRYMCTQTVDRARYEPDSSSSHSACDTGPERAPVHLTTSDRLRVDVAMGSTKEMYYGWARASSKTAN
ncbi:MAG TPA: hypothetical protein VMH05_23735 [Bryobacteraceae bacterium]|nr:hypothetical protein [Bryobacteraceae bacterium]